MGNAYVLTNVVIAVIEGVALGGGHGDYVNVAVAAISVTVLTSLLTAKLCRRYRPVWIRRDARPGCYACARAAGCEPKKRAYRIR